MYGKNVPVDIVLSKFISVQENSSYKVWKLLTNEFGFFI